MPSSSEKRFTCNICFGKFVSEGNLLEHLTKGPRKCKWHRNTRFCCTRCGYSTDKILKYASHVDLCDVDGKVGDVYARMRCEIKELMSIIHMLLSFMPDHLDIIYPIVARTQTAIGLETTLHWLNGKNKILLRTRKGEQRAFFQNEDVTNDGSLLKWHTPDFAKHGVNLTKIVQLRKEFLEDYWRRQTRTYSHYANSLYLDELDEKGSSLLYQHINITRRRMHGSTVREITHHANRHRKYTGVKLGCNSNKKVPVRREVDEEEEKYADGNIEEDEIPFKYCVAGCEVDPGNDVMILDPQDESAMNSHYSRRTLEIEAGKTGASAVVQKLQDDLKNLGGGIPDKSISAFTANLDVTLKTMAMEPGCDEESCYSDIYWGESVADMAHKNIFQVYVNDIEVYIPPSNLVHSYDIVKNAGIEILTIYGARRVTASSYINWIELSSLVSIKNGMSNTSLTNFANDERLVLDRAIASIEDTDRIESIDTLASKITPEVLTSNIDEELFLEKIGIVDCISVHKTDEFPGKGVSIVKTFDNCTAELIRDDTLSWIVFEISKKFAENASVFLKDAINAYIRRNPKTFEDEYSPTNLPKELGNTGRIFETVRRFSNFPHIRNILFKLIEKKGVSMKPTSCIRSSVIDYRYLDMGVRQYIDNMESLKYILDTEDQEEIKYELERSVGVIQYAYIIYSGINGLDSSTIIPCEYRKFIECCKSRK